MNLSIVPLERSSLPALLQMWRGYQEFYQITDIDERRNREHVEGRSQVPGRQRSPGGSIMKSRTSGRGASSRNWKRRRNAVSSASALRSAVFIVPMTCRFEGTPKAVRE